MSPQAGGFLALDWNDHSPTGPLTRASFALHETLAAELEAAGHAVDYRRLSCEAVAASGATASGAMQQRKLSGIEWADINVVGSRNLGTEATIAQVHPKKLCEALWTESERAGCSLIVGEVKGIETALDDDGVRRVDGVRIEGANGDSIVEPAATVVLACGPWSPRWLNLPQIHGVKYHSILKRSDRVLSQAVFFQGLGDPEVYPRPDGNVYITGFPDDAALVTERPGSETVRPDVTARPAAAIAQVSSELGSAPTVLEQACHLPFATDGLPVLGGIGGVGGAYVATGAGCWGILLGPITGKAMAELIVDGRSSDIDLEPFSPKRFATSVDVF